MCLLRVGSVCLLPCRSSRVRNNVRLPTRDNNACSSTLGMGRTCCIFLPLCLFRVCVCGYFLGYLLGTQQAVQEVQSDALACLPANRLAWGDHGRRPHQVDHYVIIPLRSPSPRQFQCSLGQFILGITPVIAFADCICYPLTGLL